MSSICRAIHEVSNALEIHSFPFSDGEIPGNGISILFERGETAHGGHRIVRIGSHRGDGRLPSRMDQHFIQENKDRSILRKNIGRCFLHRDSDPFLEDWNVDLTSREARDRYAGQIDSEKQAAVERQVTEYIRETFSLAVLEVGEREARQSLLRKLIATISFCDECEASENWLGLASPEQKIRDSGLWQTQHLYKETSWLG